MLRSLAKLLATGLAVGLVLLTLAFFCLRWLGWDVALKKTAGSSFTFRADARDPVPNDESVAEALLPMVEMLVPSEDAQAPPVKNLVVLLADGLGFNHLVAARTALVGARGRLLVERFPVSSWHTTFSAAGMYTDSAAGATALATGVLTTPGYLSVDVDGNPVTTLMEEAIAAGRSTAVVTDSYLWDASPAAWLVHYPGRRPLEDIARQMAESGVDIAYGEARSDGEEALAARLQPVRDAGFDVLTRPEDFERPWTDGQPRMAALPSGTIADPDTYPRLVDLVAEALDRLTRNANGFVLFVETEEVDSGAHNGDLDRVIRGLGALDEAARLVVETLGGRDDTLIVFTGDHETGGLTLANSRADEQLVPMWAWGHHTSSPVPILAWGAGAARLGGVHDNAEVGRILRSLMTPLAPQSR